jgi:mRNA-degrading endonuclease RelE of RelBE toxin-antitoxin system
MKVEISDQVVDFVRRLAPDPRRVVRKALRDLAAEKGDIKPLEGPLDGYCRLRVGTYRILFAYVGRNTIQCVFAERRSIIYEVFAQVLNDELTRGR